MSKSRQLKKRDVVGLQLTVKKKKFNVNKSGEHIACIWVAAKRKETECV